MTLLYSANLAGPGVASLANLLQEAHWAGVSVANIISVEDIVCEQRFADMCRQPRCENYGLSPSCPPHVAGPEAFKKWLADYEKAIFFRIDVPFDILFSSERRDCFQLLHEIAAGTELAGIDLGFRKSRAYAGGSCKQIFCHDRLECRVLAQRGICRYPQSARPSMSGYGIDVTQLIKAAGWSVEGVGPDAATKGRMANLYGLVLIG